MGVVGSDGEWSPVFRDQADWLREWPTIDVLRSGRGYSKSTLLLLKVLMGSLKWSRMQSTYLAPVSLIFQQAVYPKLRAWDYQIIREHGFSLIKSWNENKNLLTLINGSAVHFRMGTHVDHARGGDNGIIAVEEGQLVDGDQGAFAALMPSLRGIGPGCLLVGGTPDQSGGILGALCELAGYEPDSMERDHRREVEIEGQKITMRVTRRSSIDNPYYPAATIALARATLTEDRFAEEYEAVSRKPTGLMYPEFDPTVHVAKVPLQNLVAEGKPWNCFPVIDWGYTKAHISWFLMRQGRHTPEVILYHEMPLSNTEHEEICQIIGGRLNAEPATVRAVIVDAEGAGNKVARFAENRYAIQYFRQFGIPVVFTKDKAQRNIMSTAGLVRRLLKSADGRVSFTIAKECAELPCNQKNGRGTIPSFKAYRLVSVGDDMFLDKAHDDNKTTHSMDCLRLVCINALRVGYSFTAGVPSLVQELRNKWGAK